MMVLHLNDCDEHARVIRKEAALRRSDSLWTLALCTALCWSPEARAKPRQKSHVRRRRSRPSRPNIERRTACECSVQASTCPALAEISSSKAVHLEVSARACTAKISPWRQRLSNSRECTPVTNFMACSTTADRCATALFATRSRTSRVLQHAKRESTARTSEIARPTPRPSLQSLKTSGQLPPLFELARHLSQGGIGSFAKAR